MSIIDPQSVNIEIAPLSSGERLGLRLNYQGQSYDLVQAFASNKLERAQQQWQQLMAIDHHDLNIATIDRYLLVQEVGYYSLWEIDRSLLLSVDRQIGSSRSYPIDRAEDQGEIGLELQQASIWLFQELWLQWQDLLGARQLQVFADNLLTIAPQLQSWVDLDRLLVLDPLASERLESWAELDLIAFDRQLYHLTQKKMGQQFGTKLTIDIIQSMPAPLQSKLLDILGI
jgi:hypothetical protein